MYQNCLILNQFCYVTVLNLLKFNYNRQDKFFLYFFIIFVIITDEADITQIQTIHPLQNSTRKCRYQS